MQKRQDAKKYTCTACVTQCDALAANDGSGKSVIRGISTTGRTFGTACCYDELVEPTDLMSNSFKEDLAELKAVLKNCGQSKST